MATCTKCCLPLAKVDLAQYPATARGLSTVFSKPGMSLERPEIGDAKRVDPL
jgi:hypothetical protein